MFFYWGFRSVYVGILLLWAPDLNSRQLYGHRFNCTKENVSILIQNTSFRKINGKWWKTGAMPCYQNGRRLLALLRLFGVCSMQGADVIAHIWFIYMAIIHCHLPLPNFVRRGPQQNKTEQWTNLGRFCIRAYDVLVTYVYVIGARAYR